MRTEKSIAERLERLDWSMRRLARECGIRPETVADTIRHQRRTHPGTLVLIEQALARAEQKHAIIEQALNRAEKERPHDPD